jgi:hypothetical protein
MNMVLRCPSTHSEEQAKVCAPYLRKKETNSILLPLADLNSTRLQEHSIVGICSMLLFA